MSCRQETRPAALISVKWEKALTRIKKKRNLCHLHLLILVLSSYAEVGKTLLGIFKLLCFSKTSFIPSFHERENLRTSAICNSSGRSKRDMQWESALGQWWCSRLREPAANHRRVRAKFNVTLNSISVPGRYESKTLQNWVL